MADAPADGADRPVRRSARHAATVARRRRRRRRVLLLVAVVLIPITYSYSSALTGPGSDSLSARSVEWMREHHLGGVVDTVERHWYAHHQAKVGGTPNVATAAPQLAITATSGIFSAFLVNDAICLVLAPLVLELTRQLGRKRPRRGPYSSAQTMSRR